MRLIQRHGCTRGKVRGLLSELRHLETFVCNVLECETKGCMSCSSWTELSYPRGRLDTANHFMEVCPSLRHIALRVKSQKASGWLWFRKSRDGVTIFAGEGILSDSLWREKPFK